MSWIRLGPLAAILAILPVGLTNDPGRRLETFAYPKLTDAFEYFVR